MTRSRNSPERRIGWDVALCSLAVELLSSHLKKHLNLPNKALHQPVVAELELEVDSEVEFEPNLILVADQFFAEAMSRSNQPGGEGMYIRKQRWDGQDCEYVAMAYKNGHPVYLYRHEPGGEGAKQPRFPYWLSETQDGVDPTNGEPHSIVREYPMDPMGNLYYKLDQAGKSIVVPMEQVMTEYLTRFMFTADLSPIEKISTK